MSVRDALKNSSAKKQTGIVTKLMLQDQLRSLARKKRLDEQVYDKHNLSDDQIEKLVTNGYNMDFLEEKKPKVINILNKKVKSSRGFERSTSRSSSKKGFGLRGFSFGKGDSSREPSFNMN